MGNPKKTLQEAAEQRRPFDEAMVLVSEGGVGLEAVARDVAEGQASPTVLRERLERARTMLSAAGKLLDGVQPDARELPSWVARQLWLIDELLADLG